MTLTGRPLRPAASNRSVWRHRNAGIWITSATSAAAATSAGACTSVSSGTPTSRLTRASTDNPSSTPKPRNASSDERLALSYDDL